MKKVPRPTVNISSYCTISVFFRATEVGHIARHLLCLASSFRTHGANLYELCSNESIEQILCLSHGQFMRAKKQLRDAGLLDYDGNPGNYSHLIERWERVTGEKWELEI